MKILWLTNYFAPYRLPVWIEITRMARVHVILLESKKRVTKDSRRGADWVAYRESPHSGLYVSEFSTWRLGAGERRVYIPLSRFNKFLPDVDVAVIGLWESPAAWMLLAQAKRKGVTCIGFYESTLKSQHFKRGPVNHLRTRFFNSLDAVVASGADSTKALLSMGVPRAKIFTGFNAVDVAKFDGQSGNSDENTMWTFAYVGQLIARKNIDSIINAFSEVRSPEDTLLILGDGELNESLRDQVAKLGLEDYVTFHGSIINDELPNLILKCETLVLASTEEVWGLVVNEALAAGCHVVVSDVTGVAASVQEMQGVYLCKPSVKGIAEAMAKSRNAWSGRIENPEILKHTPEKFAHVFLDAIAFAKTNAFNP